MKHAEDVRFDVQAELEWEPSLDAAGIGVAVQDGAVTLTGHVKSYTEKLAAEKAAKRVKGVVAVANDLLVHPAGARRDDSDIAKAVTDALRWNMTVPSGIQAVVTQGWVKLAGTVDWDFQRRAAYDTVRPIEGVRGVVNDITLKPRATPSEVKQRIESAFRRSAQIDAEHVTVSLTGSTAILNGNVRSWSERKEAEHAAWSAPGVMRVENNLVVQPAVMAAL
jgi:osmotically-inducible protein OsmY